VSDWTLVRLEPPRGLAVASAVPTDSGLALPDDFVDAASSLSPSIDSFSVAGLFKLAVDPLGLSGDLAPEPGILDFSELLSDLDEPCVSDLENEG